MAKQNQTLLFTILLIPLSMLAYLTFTCANYSLGYFFVVNRIAMMGLCYYYFYRLTKHIYTRHTRLKQQHPQKFKNTGWTALPVFSTLLYLVLVSIGTEKLNTYLLNTENYTTNTAIEGCHTSRGTEYCYYTYFAGDRFYKIKCLNRHHFRDGDTSTLLYYPKFPVISKIKKDCELAGF